MPRCSTLLTLHIILMFASQAFCAEGLAKPRSNSASQGLPVTHVLRRDYQMATGSITNGGKMTESKYKDVSGRTVSTAYTVGNMTTHKNLDGRIIGYSVAINGKSKHYDAHGREMQRTN